MPRAQPSMYRRAKSAWSGLSAKMKAATVVTALIIGVTGSIVGVANAYPIVEPWFYVSRSQLRLIMDKQAAATDRQTLYQLKSDLDRAKKDLASAPSETVRERVDEIQQQIKDTEARVRNAPR